MVYQGPTDKKSLFWRRGPAPAGTNLKKRVYGEIFAPASLIQVVPKPVVQQGYELQKSDRVQTE